MSLEDENHRPRKKLVWTAAAIILISLIAFAVVYVNISNTLNSALFRLLSTFDLERVTYPSVTANAIDVNITFLIRNPTSYTARINTITLSFWVNDIDIESIDVDPEQDLPPGEEGFFYFFPHVTDDRVLTSFNNRTYQLTVKGTIRASTGYFAFGASRNRDIDALKQVNGTM